MHKLNSQGKYLFAGFCLCRITLVEWETNGTKNIVKMGISETANVCFCRRIVYGTDGGDEARTSRVSAYVNMISHAEPGPETNRTISKSAAHPHTPLS